MPAAVFRLTLPLVEEISPELVTTPELEYKLTFSAAVICAVVEAKPAELETRVALRRVRFAALLICP